LLEHCYVKTPTITNLDAVFDGYRIRHEKLIELFDDTRCDIENTLRSSEPLAAKHNRFCLYNLLVLMYATGARPVNDTLQDLGLMNFQHGIASLQDKETAEYASLHFVGLAELARQQGIYYIDHLVGLASQYMTHYGDTYNLVRGIARRAQGAQNSTLPFFFLIEGERTDSISPTHLADYLANFTPLPPNFNRHAVTAETSIASGSMGTLGFSEISAFLGHQPIGTHLFGPESELCQREVLDLQAKQINLFLESIQFSPLKGLKPHQKTLVIDGTFKKETALHLVDELGIENRARKRREKLESDVFLAFNVEKLLESAELKKRIDMKAASNLREEVEYSNYPVGNHWQSLITGHGDTKDFLHVFPPSKRKLNLALDTTPFSTTTLPDLLRLENARDAWRALLKKYHTHREFHDVISRAAMILVTAALFGGLVTVRRLRALIRGLKQDIYKTNQGLIYFELWAGEMGNPTHLGRWVPDRLTESLILGLRRTQKKTKASFPDEQTALSRLAEILALVDISTTQSRCLVRLARLARVSAYIDYPSYLTGFVLEKTGTQIKPPAWVRLTTGLIPKWEKESLYEVEVGDWLPLLSPNTVNLAQLKPIKRSVTELFSNQTVDTSNAKAALALDLKDLSRKYNDAPVICHLALGWAVSICLTGTIRAGTDVKLSTIGNYVMLVINALFASEAAKDFLDLNDLEYEDLYTSAVDNATQKDQSTLVAQLQLFHGWVVENYDDIEHCSFSPVWDVASKHKANVSANTISEAEYERAIQLINSDNNLSDRYHVQYKAILILLRRFGLRLGEAYQLRKVDIEHVDDWSYVVVQVNRIGGRRVKSEHGIRQVAIVEDLKTDEIEILKTLTSTHFLEDFNTPISSISGNSMERISKNEISAYLNSIIKLVTHDRTASLKHLRHAHCSHVHAKIIADRYGELASNKTAPWLDRAFDLFNLTEGSYDKPVKALSLLLGHSALPTSVYSYLHALDVCPHPGDRVQLEKQFTAKALAQILGESFDSYRKRKISAREAIRYAADTSGLLAFDQEVDYTEYDHDAAALQLQSINNKAISPGVIAEIFFYILSRNPNQNFTHEAFNVSKSQFWTICNIGDRLENDTDFDDYILANIHDSTIDRITPLTHPNVAQHARVRAFFRDFDEAIIELYQTNKDLLTEVDRIWCQAIQPKKYSLQINLEDRFDLLSELFSRIFVSFKVSNFTKSSSRAVVKRDSIRRRRKQVRPPLRYKLDFEKLLKSNEASINCEQDLHKVLFIITTWYRLQEFNDANNNKSIQSDRT